MDALKGRHLQGWIFDPAKPDARLSVTVYVDGEPILVSVADIYRADLQDAGIGDGAHSFSAVLPSRLFDGSDREISVRATESGGQIACKRSSFAFDKSLGPSTIGRFVKFEGQSLIGYVYDLIDRDVPIDVRVVRDGVVLSSTRADGDAAFPQLTPSPPSGSAFSLDLTKFDLGELADGKLHVEALPSEFRFENVDSALRSVAVLVCRKEGFERSFRIAVNSEIRVPVSFDVFVAGSFVETVRWRPDAARTIELGIQAGPDDGVEEISVRIAGSDVEIGNSPYRSTDVDGDLGRGFSRASHRTGARAVEWVGVIEPPRSGYGGG